MAYFTVQSGVEISLDKTIKDLQVNSNNTFLLPKKPLKLTSCVKDGITIYQNGIKFIFDIGNCEIFQFN